MSGTNPFRRKNVERPSDDPITIEAKGGSRGVNAYVPPIHTDIPRISKPKASKTVRIISPHSAPSDADDSSAHDDLRPSRIFSPPLPKPATPESAYSETSDGSVIAGSDEATWVAENDRRERNTLSNIEWLPDHVSALPVNPFRKTLDNVEGIDIAEEGLSGPAASSQKPQYDVDDFKALLLTGKKLSHTPQTETFNIPKNGPAQAGDDNSNDETSFSRQSVSEIASVPLSDAPRTSHDASISDNENQKMVAAAELKPERIKPTLPRHRHGKSVTANTPQTVSFEDPALSLLTTEPSTLSPSRQAALLGPIDNDQKRSSRRGSLPPIDQSFAAALTSPSRMIRILDSARDQLSQKNAPPAPPPSSRHGQIHSNTLNTASRRSSLLVDEAHTSAEAYAQSLSINSTKPAPPPPRRHMSLRRDSSPSHPSAASGFTPTEEFARPKKSLPTPPTRSPAIDAAKRPTVASPQSGSPSTPPPPPPRRRGSSQGSYTPSRLSGDYRHIISQRPRGGSGASSISQLQMPPPEASTQQSSGERKDPLADLSALQREVDEYRGKMGR